MTHSLVKKSKFTPQEWVHKIKFSAAAAAVIATGQSLEKAKDDLGHGNFMTMFAEHPKHVNEPLYFSVSTADKLMSIGRHALLSNSDYSPNLPAAWTILYTLTKVPDKYLLRGFDNGVIRPDMKGKDVKLLLPKGKVITPALPEGKYRCLVIDPPWPVEKIAFERRPVEQQDMDYATMSLEEIADLPVPGKLDEDGTHVYLWVTHKFIPEGLRLFEKWGIRYECILTWHKPTAMPLWWMFNTEHVLFGKFGSLPPLEKGVPVGFHAPQQRHSHKPEEFYGLVRRVSPEPRLTMFDEPREGFTNWGVQHAKSCSA